MSHAIDRLLRIMTALRDPDTGCAWDLAQSYATIAPYTIEEAYEVADAIERNDYDALREELGDLLLQVVFHAKIAEQDERFDFHDVAAAIADKMEQRHPHVFGQAQDDHSREARWEQAKADERAAKGQSGALDGVAQALPALMRAEKLQKRAARAGFDWPDTTEPEALRAGNAKFERRFKAMEVLSDKKGHVFSSLTLDEQEELWQTVKASEADKPA